MVLKTNSRLKCYEEHRQTIPNGNNQGYYFSRQSHGTNSNNRQSHGTNANNGFCNKHQESVKLLLCSGSDID